MARGPFSRTRAPNTTAACVAIAAAASLGSGCSFIFSESAPADHRARASFQCGESYAPPVVDTIGAGAFALLAASAQSAKDENVAGSNHPEQTRHDIDVAIGIVAAFAAVDAASAIFGYHAVGDCRAAQETRLGEVARARVLPPPYGVPPYGEPPLLWPPLLAAPAPPSAPTEAPPTPPQLDPPSAPEAAPVTPSP